MHHLPLWKTFNLSSRSGQVELFDYWNHQVKGATLQVLYHSVHSYLAPNVFEDAIVLHTTKGDVALMVDASGARAAVGTFHFSPSEVYQFWFTPPSVYREWRLAEITNAIVHDMHIGGVLGAENYWCCHEFAILVGHFWLHLYDRQDFMCVELLPNTEERFNCFSRFSAF